MENRVTKMMRVAIVLLLTTMVVACGMWRHTADDIINDMRDARHAQYVNVGNGLFGLGRLISPTLYEAGLGINSIQVLDLSKCGGNDREKFRKRIMDLSRNGAYEEIITRQDSYDTKTALVRRDGQYVSEIVLVNASEMNDVMVLILGHINVENLERILNDKSIASASHFN
jgi:hypothetical protein